MLRKPNQLTKWEFPFVSHELSNFYNTIGDDGVLGLALRRTDGISESACLLVSTSEHTQKVMYQLFQEGQLYEPHTTAIVIGALTLGDIAIDVGAHVGYFTSIFRLCVGGTGSVFAFEPMPSTFRRLLKNILGNRFNNVMALPIALSDESGEAVFYMDSENEGESSLMVRPGLQSCVVQLTCLDDMFQDFLAKRPRVLKLDAEGVELKILKGGESFFQTHAPDLVICEHNRGALYKAGITPQELRHFFDIRGYRCGVINNGYDMDMRGATFYRMIEPGEQFQADNYGYVFNLMFVREGSGLYPDEMM